jgi:hypothetical protein
MSRNLRRSLAGISASLLSMALMFNLTACSSEPDVPGRLRVTAKQVIGSYKFGSDRLELKSDGTYTQDIAFDTQQLHRTGYWEIMNHFVDGTEVLLIDAAITAPTLPNGNNHGLIFGDLPMYVHLHSGKIALARNEIAQWYYERLD